MEQRELFKAGIHVRVQNMKEIFQEIFKALYAGRDEKKVYLKDVVIYLRAADKNIDDNIQVGVKKTGAEKCQAQIRVHSLLCELFF